MRLDKFLKVSRLIKRRTVANEVCDSARVFVNDNPAKPAKQLKVGDVISIEYKNMTKIAILGDMGELGSRSALWHAQLADDLQCIDTVLLCGDHMRHLHAQNPNKFIWFSNIDELKESIVIPDNSVILVKGSRFMKMESVVNFILERYKNVI